MAYTSVIPVRRLDRAVKYVMNKEKTTAVSLQDALDYAANRDKTEQSCFESSYACTLETAFADMRQTKEQWHKSGGVQGYHLVQSFAAGEVTPELAHQIAKELADRVLGGQYEYVIGTHLNTGHKKNTGQLPQYYIENYHEGIVSKQMFREVQAEIARRNSKSAANQRKRRRGRYNSKYALSERLFCGNCGSPYKRVTWNIHGRKQIVWRCVNRIEYGTKFCSSSPSVPEEELHRAILKAIQGLAANFTDEVAAQINGILHSIQTGESIKPNLQEQLEQTQQEFDRLLEMSLDFDEDTPFLDDRLKKLNSKIKRLKKAIDDSAAQQEKASQSEMLLSAKVLQIQEYDDALTARIIEKITVRSRNEIEIRFIGGYKKTMQLT